MCSRRTGVNFQKKGKIENVNILNKNEMYLFYLNISKRNEKVNNFYFNCDVDVLF